MSPRKHKPPTTWKVEADLCAAMIKALRNLGWRCYPEHAGYDFVAVCPSNGFHHGVQAKLQANLKVLEQASRPHTGRSHVRVVLVPRAAPEFKDLAKRLGVEVIEADTRRGMPDALDAAAELDHRSRRKSYHAAQAGEILLPLPPESDLPCGVPSPKPITPWKLAAVTFCMERGWGESPQMPSAMQPRLFTIADFRAALGGAKHQHPRLWVDKGWATVAQDKVKPHLYVLTDAHDLPSKQYPEIVELITRDRLQKAVENQPK